jgi:hypothetical protein
MKIEKLRSMLRSIEILRRPLTDNEYQLAIWLKKVIDEREFKLNEKWTTYEN